VLNRFLPVLRLLTSLNGTSGWHASSMAWKRSSVPARPGPPILQQLEAEVAAINKELRLKQQAAEVLNFRPISGEAF
jgi:hypothetical protein